MMLKPLERLSMLFSQDKLSIQCQQKSRQTIKQQLQSFREYVSQQLIKLSAYYETKLQYQAGCYEDEIGVLKQEIERQYKVIGLMKNQLEDLVVMVNMQRANDGEKKHENGQNNEEEYKEWRVKSGQVWDGNNNKNNTNAFQQKQLPLSSSQGNGLSPQQNRGLTSQNQPIGTIFGLEIIAEEQTQRTLVSVCDEEVNQNSSGDIEGEEFGEDSVQEGNDFGINNGRSIEGSPQRQEDHRLGKDEQKQSQHQQSQQQLEQLQSPVWREQSIQALKESVDNNHHSSGEKDDQNQFLCDREFLRKEKKDVEIQFDGRVDCYEIKEELPGFGIGGVSIKQQEQALRRKYEEFLFDENRLQEQGQSEKISRRSRHSQSIKPSIYYTEEVGNDPKPSKRSQNFIENPFSKKKMSVQETASNHFQSDYNGGSKIVRLMQNNRSPNCVEQHQNPSPTRMFLQEFRRSFNSEKQIGEGRRSQQEEVMEILEMIAMKGSTEKSKRSDRKERNMTNTGGNLSNSRSKGKKHPQTSSKPPNSRKRTSTEQSHRLQYTDEGQQQFYPQSISSQYRRSRVSIGNRYQTQENCENEMGQNGMEFERQNGSEYWALSNQLRSKELGYKNSQQMNEERFRSLQTTFGRPGSFESLREVNQACFNTGVREGVLDNQMQKRTLGNNNKGSKNSLKSKNTNQKPSLANKQNERQRRMSEKIASSSKSSTSIGFNSMLEKKNSTKYLRRNPQSQMANQSSISSMLQSHLEQSNKFMIGSKKQEIKYDGERVSNGQVMVKHGHGVLYYSNGLIYEGEFVDNRREGYGLLKFNHVELYSGEWMGDELSGKGKIRNCAIINKKKKQSSEGLSSSSSSHGNYNLSSTNSIFQRWISYCGEFRSNRFEGEGTLYLQGGEKFVGWFRNGVADGEGSLFKKNGEVESGRWKNNILVEKYETQWN